MKSTSAFYARKSNGRLFVECKECNNRRSRGWFARHGHERVEENTARVRRNRRQNPKALLLRQAKSRAKHKGIEFSITSVDVQWVDVCPVFGLPLIYGGSGEGKALPGSASLDRIDNTKGYVPGNVMVISHRANGIKRDATLDELEALTGWLRKALGHAQ